MEQGQGGRAGMAWGISRTDTDFIRSVNAIMITLALVLKSGLARPNYIEIPAQECNHLPRITSVLMTSITYAIM